MNLYRNKRGFVSIPLLVIIVLLVGTDVVFYQQENLANVLDLFKKNKSTEEARVTEDRIVNPQNLPIAEQEVIKQEIIQEKEVIYQKPVEVIRPVEKEKEPYIKVISPNGGESLEAGTTHEVVWESNGIEENVQIDIYQKGVDRYTQIDYVSNTGSYNWAIHEDYSGEFKIIVRGMVKGNKNKQVRDESDSYFNFKKLQAEQELKKTQENFLEETQYLGFSPDETCPSEDRPGWSCFSYREDGECKFICKQYSASDSDTNFLFSSFEDLLNYNKVNYHIDTEDYSIYNDKTYPKISVLKGEGEDIEIDRCYLSDSVCQENFDELKSFFENLEILIKDARPVTCSPWKDRGDGFQSEIYKDHLVLRVNNYDRRQGESFDYSLEVDFVVRGEKKNSYLIELRIGDYYCYEGQVKESLLNDFSEKLSNFVNSF